MENDTYLFSSLPYGQQSGVRMTAGVAGDPNLAAGLLLGYFFIGLASYFWAFWSQYSRLTVFKEAISLSCSGEPGSLRGVRMIYNVIPSLVFIDIVNAITAIILAVELIGSCQSAFTCAYVIIAWFLSRWFGLIIHLLNALLCLLVLCHPQWGAKMRIVYSAVVLLMTAFCPFYIYRSQAAIIGLGAITIGLALAIIAKCTKSTASPSAAASKKLIVLLAVLTFVIVFAPTFILECLVMNAINHGELADKYATIYVNVLFFTNCQLVMNGLLCYAILKLPPEEEEMQQEQQQQQQTVENINYDNFAIAP